MPTITLQVGQCGNQLGSTWWSLLSRQQQQLEHGLHSGEWFRTVEEPGSAGQYTLLPRVISLDSEAKVVRPYNSTLAQHQTHVLGHGGCGNNWAYGYQFGQKIHQQPSKSSAWSTITEESITKLEQVLAGVRKECEAAHGVPDFLMTASLAGGTGSGLGSALLEAVADEYPASTIAAVAVAPSRTGNSAMQSINSCLALQHLDMYAHVIILVENQAYLDRLNKQLITTSSSSSTSSISSRGGLSTKVASVRAQSATSSRSSATSSLTVAAGFEASKQASVTGGACLSDVNQAAAEALAGLLWPLRDDEPADSSNIRKLASTICADPLYKTVELCHISQTERQWMSNSSSNSWPARLQLLASQLPKFDQYRPSQPVVTSAAWLITRGMPGTSQATAVHNLVSGASSGASRPCLQQSWDGDNSNSSLGWQRDVSQAVCSSWPHFSGDLSDVSVDHSPSTLLGASKQRQPSITAAVRRSSTGTLMQAAAHRALQLYEAGAYMHWYEQFGCDRQAIRDAAHAVADIAAGYLR